MLTHAEHDSRCATPVAAPLGPSRAPQVSPALVRRTIVGLRPFRADGAVVRAEAWGDKVVVHHYGHGGCGVTLSWGTAAEAVALSLATPHRRAAVLGAGAVALAAAALLVERGVAVTIYARAWEPAALTSGVAGAFWAPFTFVAPERRTPALAARLAGVARVAHRRFAALVGERHGVRRLPLYVVGDEPPALPWEMAAVPELFDGPLLPPGAHPFGARHVRRTETMAVETARYLPALLDDVRGAGTRLERVEFAHREDVARLPEPLVVNCTGLGARALVGDGTLVPVRGQLTLLAPQPAVDYMLMVPARGLYMLPRCDGLLLGASHGHGNWSTVIDEEQQRRLLDAFATFFASTDCVPSGDP